MVKLRIEFLRSRIGILYLGILILLLLDFICIIVAYGSVTRTVYLIATILGCIVTVFFVLTHNFDVFWKNKLPWCKIEMALGIKLAILFIVISCFTFTSGSAAYTAAGIFGLATGIGYLIRSALLYRNRDADKVYATNT